MGSPTEGSAVVLRLGGTPAMENLVDSGADGYFILILESAPIAGGSVCASDEDYRTLAATEIGAGGGVVLTVEGD